MKETKNYFENLYAEEIAEELSVNTIEAMEDDDVLVIEIPAYELKKAINAKLRQQKIEKISKRLTSEEKWLSQKSDWAPSNCHKQLKYAGHKAALIDKLDNFTDSQLDRILTLDMVMDAIASDMKVK